MMVFFSNPGYSGEMAAKHDVFLERQTIRKFKLEEARNNKEELKKILKGRFLFLKMLSLGIKLITLP